jgi:Ca-activated chloride channel homolog
MKLLVWFSLCFAVLTHAQEPHPAGYDQLGEPVPLAAAGSGQLLLATTVPGAYLPAPALEAEVAIEITGLVARTRVTQRFRNPTDVWVEGIYVFPLPSGSAVDQLHLVVGDRVIPGEIHEQQEAERIFAEARATGQRASMLSQERPNLFTTAVTNLGPGEHALVVIHYQEDLRYDAGTFELRFPMVAAPRYVPGVSTAPTPPVVAAGAALNLVALAVELDAGFPLAELDSPSHPLEVEKAGETGYQVRPRGGPVPADRDFVLRWRPAVGQAPRAAVFTEQRDDGVYALVMVMPPSEKDPAATVRLPRETVLILDTSGSMSGASIEQARESLRFALARLAPEDSFNVIEFNSFARKLFAESQPAHRELVEEAQAFVAGLDANGGTEMLPALKLAFEGPTVPGAVRQVIFVTDGSVGNEAELLAYLGENLGDSRLYTVAIGSAPNSFFMEEAATRGRGTFTHIGRPEDVAEKMGELFAKLESPVLSGLELTWSDPRVEAWPEKIPDLYLGEPVVVAARMVTSGARVEVRGRRGDEPWNFALRLGTGEPQTGIEKLWARRKVASLLRRQGPEVDAAEIRREVTELGLEHHLVTPYTRLVAVDPTPAAPAGTVPLVRALPVNLPAGWDFGGAYGELPQGGTAWRLLVLLGLAGLAAAAALGRRS